MLLGPGCGDDGAGEVAGLVVPVCLGTSEWPSLVGEDPFTCAIDGPAELEAWILLCGCDTACATADGGTPASDGVNVWSVRGPG